MTAWALLQVAVLVGLLLAVIYAWNERGEAQDDAYRWERRCQHERRLRQQVEHARDVERAWRERQP